jgi:NAD(P)H-hydrate epimerase
VAARRLAGWGTAVHVVISRPDDRFSPAAAHQLAAVRRLDIPVHDPEAAAGLPCPDVVVDGLIGYSVDGPPRGGVADLIRWANGADAPILSLDIPSGLHPSTGHAYEPTIRATATLTLALPKRGLRAEEAGGHVGELYLGDIGIPPQAYASPSLGLAVEPIFSRQEILRLV